MPHHDELLAASRRLILDNQAPTGAYPACEEFPAYAGYCWFRDGSFIAHAMSSVGEVASADRFHDWCAGVLADRAGRVSGLIATARSGSVPPATDMLPTRFTWDGTEGGDPWWDFQLDGYGTWLWAVHAHADRHGRDAARWSTGIKTACDYLIQFWNRPCYDWWEENPGERHTSTLGAIYAGLTACAASPVLDADSRDRARLTAAAVRTTLLTDCVTAAGSFAKWAGAEVVDASLAACVVPFGVVEAGDPPAEATLAAIETDLCFGGGVHRYAADVFYGGGQWPLLTCFLAWNHLAAGRRERAAELFEWAAAQADEAWEVPEQVPAHLMHPQTRDEWVVRWGPVAKPLLWSHAMILILGAELGLVGNSPEVTP